MNGNRIAVPYYGRLHQRNMGYERIFFIVDTLMDEKARMNVRLGVWDYKKKTTLPEWLKTNGIDSVICTERLESRRQKDITDAGIEVMNNRSQVARYILKKLMI